MGFLRCRCDLAVAAVAVVLGVGTAAGCGRDDDVLPRVLLIGLDGADPDAVSRLAAEGRLPQLSDMMEKGVTGELATVGSSSPVIWTSIATGVRPARHGINWFVGSTGRPLNATDRRRPAFWNVLSHYGRTVGVIDWWVTFPVESVRGYLIAPYLDFRPVTPGSGASVEIEWRDGEQRYTHPRRLEKEVLPLMVEAHELRSETLRRAHAAGITTHTPWVLARDESALRVALHQMDAMPVEMLALYFQAIDVASHDYTRYVFGGSAVVPRPQRVDDAARARAIARVDVVYEATDRKIADLVAAAGDDTDVMVVSDHGWKYDGRGHATPTPGIFVAAGPSFRRGAALGDVSVLDVLPTILRVLGVPISERLDGSVIDAALVDDVAPATFVDAWPIAAVGPIEGKAESPRDDDLVDLLESLGYLGMPATDGAGGEAGPAPAAE